MKKILKTIIVLMAVTSIALVFALPAFAADNRCLGIIGVSEDGKNVSFAGPGLAVADSDTVVILSGYKYTGNEAAIVFMTDTDKYRCYADDNGTIYMDLTDDPAIVELGIPSEGQRARLEYYTSAKEKGVTEVTLTNFHIDNYLLMTVEGLPNDIGGYPAFIIDDGYLLGFVNSNGAAAAVWVRDQSQLGGTTGGSNGSSGGTTGNSGGTSGSSDSTGDKTKSIIIIAVAVVAAAALLIVLIRKRNTQQNGTADSGIELISNDIDIKFDGGGFNDEYVTKPTVSDTDMMSPAIPLQVNNNTVYTLRCVGGYMDGRTYTMNGSELTIGRSVGSVICYPDDTKGVSRNHCKLFMYDGKLMLMDMGSSFGTFLDGKGRLLPDAPMPVKRGDAFCVGDMRNKFVIE